MSRRAAISGTAAAALALAVMWAASRVERDLPFAPLGLSEFLIRLAPGDAATFMIETFRHDALRLAAAGGVAAFLAAGGLAAALTAPGVRARPLRAGAVFGLLALAGSLGANVRPSFPAAAATAAFAALVYASGLGLLEAAKPRATTMEAGISRRRALLVIGSAAFAFTAVGSLLGRLVRGSGPGDVALRGVRRARIPERGGFPAIDGLSAEVTTPGDHYIVDINLAKPRVDADAWRLEVGGLVEEPLELGFDELQRRFEVVEEYSVLTCVSNEVGGPLVGSSAWAGVRLAEVLAAAGMSAQARDVVFHCVDGYTVAIPATVAVEEQALLALGQGGAPLTEEHGFPCRLRVARLYGMMNAKWIERIEVVDYDYRGFWARRGWSDIGIVRTQSRIDTVSPTPKVGRPSAIAGVAWAGDRGVSRVEVSLDGGDSWREARLRTPLSPLAWTQWVETWVPVRRGEHAILCRATDGAGERQDARRRPPHPAGATGYHRREVEVA